MVISDGIPAFPRNRKSRNSVPNPSVEEKTTRDSVLLNKNRSKLSEFPSEPFIGRENNSEFQSVEPNKTQTLGIPFQTLQRKKKQPGIPFRGTKIEANSWNSAPDHSAEEKTSQSKTRQPKISKIVSEKTTFEVLTNNFLKLICLFCKTSFIECTGRQSDHRGCP
jgi:hypothetical protein